jgi:hypothetical protein
MDGGDGDGDDGVGPEMRTGGDLVGGQTEGDGADGRDDLMSADEAKTLQSEDFRWRTDDTKYYTRASRGKLGYGQGPENNVQPIQPFGVALKPAIEESKGDKVFKQADERFEPFRGRQHIVETSPRDEEVNPEGGRGEEIIPAAQNPFAKINGQIIWIPFYERVVRFFFTAQDFEELVSNVVEEGSKLKLKAPDPSIISKMKETVSAVRESLRVYGLKSVILRHEGILTQYAEWLELKQIMKAIAKYQKTTSGEYNTPGLFSGNLRESVSRAIDEAVGKMPNKRRRTLGRGLEGSRATKTDQDTKDEAADFQPYNPFMVKEQGLRRVRETMPRFF